MPDLKLTYQVYALPIKDFETLSNKDQCCGHKVLPGLRTQGGLAHQFETEHDALCILGDKVWQPPGWGKVVLGLWTTGKIFFSFFNIASISALVMNTVSLATLTVRLVAKRLSTLSVASYTGSPTTSAAAGGVVNSKQLVYGLVGFEARNSSRNCCRI